MDSNIYAVEFAGNRLDLLPGAELFNHDATRLPTRIINIHKIARRNVSIITSAEYAQKEITVYIDVCGDTRADTEGLVATLKSYVQPVNDTLRVNHAGSVVQYTATLNEFNVQWNANKAYCELVFIASTPIGEGETAQTLFAVTGATASNTTESFIVGGSYSIEPRVTIVYTAVGGGTDKEINLYNTRTSQGVVITGTFTSGDVVEVDSKNYKVLHNGANIDYTGLFPTFGAGPQTMTYSDTFTSRTMNINATYRIRV